MRKFSDLSDAELTLLKTAHAHTKRKDCPGDTRWCDRLYPWERFENNVDDTVYLLFHSRNVTEEMGLKLREDNPELYDLIKSTFATVP